MFFVLSSLERGSYLKLKVSEHSNAILIQTVTWSNE